MFKIRINEFCGISRNKIWQDWLLTKAPDLHKSLMDILSEAVGGCKKNTAAMVDIYNTLVRRGNEYDLTTFLMKEFPVALEEIQNNAYKADNQVKNVDPEAYKDLQGPNKHKIFKSYNPSILSFPQRIIIIDPNLQNLNRRIRNFIKDKIDPDFLIIEDRAYIEYFMPKYKQEASKFPSEMRELRQWRNKNYK